jgi:hypothetical protein
MTYRLGSTVSRRAQDFFNDDGLYLQVGRHLFRGTQPKTGFTRASFTTSTTHHLLLAGTENPALAGKIKTFQALKAKKAQCWLTLRWSVRYT